MRQLLENAESALEKGSRQNRERGTEQVLKEKIEKLEAKVAKKDEIIAELSEEFVKAKKAAGEP
jgi:hypothetical protein